MLIFPQPAKPSSRISPLVAKSRLNMRLIVGRARPVRSQHMVSMQSLCGLHSMRPHAVSTPVRTWTAHGQHTAGTSSAHGQHAVTLLPACDQCVVSARPACARMRSAHLKIKMKALLGMICCGWHAHIVGLEHAPRQDLLKVTCRGVRARAPLEFSASCIS